jgi:ferredoxin-NADP reductase
VYDNVFWTCASAVPIWTAYEVVTFWLYANGKLPYLDFHEHPVYFAMLFLLIPFWREFHFYVIHRLIHWKPLYKSIHYLHHYNINPGPWSGLAMHPVEHLLYFSVVLIHWVVPSHPLHFLFNSQHTALTPAPSHSGFEGKLGKFLSFGSYFHYLHHRLFECNYGESTIPLDKWFGIFEDGSQTQTEKAQAASTYYPYTVTKIVDETPEVKSFYLRSADGNENRPYVSGQHLTFKFAFLDGRLMSNIEKLNGADVKYALRSYTISNNAENGEYRISVKREPKGIVSASLHAQLKEGDVVMGKGPRGSFTLQKDKRATRMFIAAGIGITPIFSMINSIEASSKEIHLMLAVKEEELLCFQDQLIEISARNPNLKVYVFLSRKAAEALAKTNVSWQFFNKRLDMDFLKQQFSNHRKLSFYICGPEKMTAELTEGIISWKGRRASVYTENFGTQKVGVKIQDGSKELNVYFAKSNKAVQWDHDYHNILEFAESHDVKLEAGCMFGECGACSTQLISGSVDYHHQTATSPAKGNCLPCSSFPTSDITLNA